MRCVYGVYRLNLFKCGEKRAFIYKNMSTFVVWNIKKTKYNQFFD